jgi:hypothetical protein
MPLFAYTAYAQNKTTYGIGLDVFQTRLHNVDRENYNGYGLSSPGFIQNDHMGLGTNFLIVFPINKKINLETGIGISLFRSQFHFDYTYQMPHREERYTLNIALFYAKLPLMLSYNVPIAPKLKLNIAGGFNTRILFASKDNYEDIIATFNGLPKTRYKLFIFSPQIALGYEHILKNKRKIRFEANAGYDLNNFTYSDSFILKWGFYENLATANYGYYGMSIKYFFTK